MAKKRLHLIHWAILGKTVVNAKDPEEAKRYFRTYEAKDIVNETEEVRITGYTIPGK